MRLIAAFACLINHGEDRSPQGFRPADRRISGRGANEARRQFDRRIRIDWPVRHEQRAGAGIEESFWPSRKVLLLYRASENEIG
jgi:hypothetical protein